MHVQLLAEFLKRKPQACFDRHFRLIENLNKPPAVHQDRLMLVAGRVVSDVPSEIHSVGHGRQQDRR